MHIDGVFGTSPNLGDTENAMVKILDGWAKNDAMVKILDGCPKNEAEKVRLIPHTLFVFDTSCFIAILGRLINLEIFMYY